MLRWQCAGSASKHSRHTRRPELRASRVAACERGAGLALRRLRGRRGREGERAVDVKLAEQAIDHERGANRNCFVAAQLALFERLAHSALDLALCGDAEVLQE